MDKPIVHWSQHVAEVYTYCRNATIGPRSKSSSYLKPCVTCILLDWPPEQCPHQQSHFHHHQHAHLSLCTSCFDTFQNDVSALKFWMSCLPSTVEADRILCPRKLTSNSFRGKSASCVPNTFPRNCHNRIRPSQRFPEVPWADSLKTGKVKYTKPRSGNYSALPYPINMQFSAPFTIYQYHWTLNILFSTCSIHGWSAG